MISVLIRPSSSFLHYAGLIRVSGPLLGSANSMFTDFMDKGSFLTVFFIEI